ncbi:MAG: hypothetical protein V4618_08625 [Pseudomonadota bacterium]
MTLHRDILMARLDEHQAKALAVIRRGDVLLAPGAVPDQLQLSQSRWELTRILTAYKAFKHHELFNPIIRNGPPDKARLAEQMKRECEALAADFLDHVSRCTNLDIAAHWSSYRPAVAALLARVNAHMARERWVVDSLLLVAVAERVGAVPSAARV